MESQLKHRTLILFTALAGLAVLDPRPAYGYLDPGTGSLIVQGAIAAIVGIATGLKLYWGRLRATFSRTNGVDSPE